MPKRCKTCKHWGKLYVEPGGTCYWRPDLSKFAISYLDEILQARLVNGSLRARSVHADEGKNCPVWEKR